MENNEKHVELTAAEISSLWTSYQNDTMAICGLRHFLTNVEDEQIRSVLEHVLRISQEHKKKLTTIFTQENYPIPQGLTEKDINLDAPRLFSDRIYLELIVNMVNFHLAIYGLALSQVERDDLISYFTGALTESQEVNKKVKEIAKDKGLLISYPEIPKAQQIDFVTKNSFLTGWFGDRRPLLGVEITALVLNAKRNALGEAIITGFAQVAKSKEVKKFFKKGQEIASKQLEVFTSILREDLIADGSRVMTSEVTKSTVAPFSDKLMMVMITTLIASGMGQYGSSMSVSPRHDLGVQYTRLIAEIAKYSNEGAKLMIDNGWMEQPPIAADRKDLAK
ncbi:DUF3231 family protein [Lentibacillus sp. Marseille-P4043]|uniref:DUF3231 family protein n=1 Tax=Lentibacillus sp. Marseille-P4043 TaxID=2040293 RepID=UPI000D0AD069|nr:DUF3231 family protein [Lentibacillus sp. Marseille-P4043]